jgi:hypothetical protein
MSLLLSKLKGRYLVNCQEISAFEVGVELKRILCNLTAILRVAFTLSFNEVTRIVFDAIPAITPIGPLIEYHYHLGICIEKRMLSFIKILILITIKVFRLGRIGELGELLHRFTFYHIPIDYRIRRRNESPYSFVEDLMMVLVHQYNNRITIIKHMFGIVNNKSLDIN